MAEVVEIKQENLVYAKPKLITENVMHYCPGCSHGTIHKLVAEVIDEMGMEGKTIAVSPVGCSVFAYNYIDVDWIQAAHGRACAVATAAKRLHPDSLVFTYQGDGDMVSEGMAEIIHAAIRGEKFSVFFVNNAIYGMTGGQMAPTTLEGQKTSTTPYGKSVEREGAPVNMAELISNIKGCVYSERVAVNTPANIAKTKRAIKKALELQKAGKGLGFVEVLSPCPTGWSMKPVQALDFLEENMIPIYPLGVFKDEEVNA